MSVRPQSPHPIFMVAWGLWYAGVLYGHVVVSPRPLWALCWLVGFFVFEVLALELKARCTLSELVTWCVRELSHHERPFEGWNWLVDIVALPISFLLFRVCYALIPTWEGALLGAGLFVPLAVLLHQHWLRPDVQG